MQFAEGGAAVQTITNKQIKVDSTRYVLPSKEKEGYGVYKALFEQ
jgi:hypothetical protein